MALNPIGLFSVFEQDSEKLISVLQSALPYLPHDRVISFLVHYSANASFRVRRWQRETKRSLSAAKVSLTRIWTNYRFKAEKYSCRLLIVLKFGLCLKHSLFYYHTEFQVHRTYTLEDTEKYSN